MLRHGRQEEDWRDCTSPSRHVRSSTDLGNSESRDRLVSSQVLPPPAQSAQSSSAPSFNFMKRSERFSLIHYLFPPFFWTRPRGGYNEPHHLPDRLVSVGDRCYSTSACMPKISGRNGYLIFQCRLWGGQASGYSDGLDHTIQDSSSISPPSYSGSPPGSMMGR